MALVNCPECQQSVSSEAETCPKCGHPVKRGLLGSAGTERTFNVGCLVIIMVGLAVAIIGCLSGCGPTQEDRYATALEIEKAESSKLDKLKADYSDFQIAYDQWKKELGWSEDYAKENPSFKRSDESKLAIEKERAEFERAKADYAKLIPAQETAVREARDRAARERP